MYIRRVEVEKYGPTSGCPGCQKVVSGAVPSCIVATRNDECRERTEKIMMQDPEGADRVVRTKTRIERCACEAHRRAKKIAKHDHHKASSDHHRHQVVWSDHQRSNKETVRTMRKLTRMIMDKLEARLIQNRTNKR